MLRVTLVPVLFFVSACGGGDPVAENLENAAEVSDPAAAQVLNSAAEQLREHEGPAPSGTAQEALERAGRAQVQDPINHSSAVQAEPNLPRDPNRPPRGEQLDTVNVAAENRQP